MKRSSTTANPDIRALKEIFGLSWREIIMHSGLSAGYFYTLIASELTPEYREIITNAIHAAHDAKGDESAEKECKRMIGKVAQSLDPESKKAMFDEIRGIIESYQGKKKARFKLEEQGDDMDE